MLLVAVTATYFLTSSSGTPAAPAADVPPTVSESGGASAKAQAGKSATAGKASKSASAEHKECASWVRDGECENNAQFMQKHCPQSCAGRAPAKAKRSSRSSSAKRGND
eukprot:1217214-Prymnesium_polylepis.1